MSSDPHRWRILAVVATAFFMTILDVSIVNVALPTIGQDLEFSRENLQWVITAYAIAFGGFLLLGGRAVGVLAGGVLTDWLGWEWIFWVNVPVGILVLLLTVPVVPESFRQTAR